MQKVSKPTKKERMARHKNAALSAVVARLDMVFGEGWGDNEGKRIAILSKKGVITLMVDSQVALIIQPLDLKNKKDSDILNFHTFDIELSKHYIN